MRCLIIIGSIVLAVVPAAWGAERKGGKVLAEFEIAPDGDFVLLPLVIRQREYRFLVCTALSRSVIDRNLCDELALPVLEPDDVGGIHAKKRHKLVARLGNNELTFPDGVETGDFSSMREGLELDFKGEL